MKRIKRIAGIAFLIGIILVVNVVDCRRSFRNVFNNYTLSSDKEYVNINLTIAQNPSRFTMFVDLFKLLDTCYCSVTLNLMTLHGKNYQNFFDKTYDMCAFFTKPDSEYMMLMVHEELSKAGKWMNRCPVKNKLYEVQNFSINTEKLPLYTPEMKYNVTIVYETRRNKNMVEILRISVFGKFDSTNDVKRRRLAIGKRTKIPQT